MLSIPNSERGLALWQDSIFNVVLVKVYYGERTFYLEMWQDGTDRSKPSKTGKTIRERLRNAAAYEPFEKYFAVLNLVT